MFDRRTFLKGLAAGAAGLLLPTPDLVLGEEARRQFWALDRTMVKGSTWHEAAWFDASIESFNKRATFVRLVNAATGHVLDEATPDADGYVTLRAPSLCRIRVAWPAEWFNGQVVLGP